MKEFKKLYHCIFLELESNRKDSVCNTKSDLKCVDKPTYFDSVVVDSKIGNDGNFITPMSPSLISLTDSEKSEKHTKCGIICCVIL